MPLAQLSRSDGDSSEPTLIPSSPLHSLHDYPAKTPIAAPPGYSHRLAHMTILFETSGNPPPQERIADERDTTTAKLTESQPRIRMIGSDRCTGSRSSG